MVIRVGKGERELDEGRQKVQLPMRRYVSCCCLVSKSCLTFFLTPQTVIHQAPLSMGFPRQEYWSGLPFPSPGDLPNPGIQPVFLVSCIGR